MELLLGVAQVLLLVFGLMPTFLLKGALAAFIVYAVYRYLIHRYPHSDRQSSRQSRKKKGTSSELRHRTRVVSASTRTIQETSTMIPASSLPAFHPFFRVSLIPYAIEANSRNRFLNIPPELRIKIYGYALYIGNVQLVKITKTTTQPTVLRLLLTCQQIRNEAEPIFFAVNQLSISEADSFKYFKQYSSYQSRTRYDFIKALTILAEPPTDIGCLILRTRKTHNLRWLRIHFVDSPYYAKHLVAIDRDGVQKWIQRLSNLKEFRITTTAPQLYGIVLQEIEAEVQAMIESRDRALA